MKDYNYVDEEGRQIPTAELPTSLIQELLRTGIEIDSSDCENATVENVLERLRIELLIREMGLR